MNRSLTFSASRRTLLLGLTAAVALGAAGIAPRAGAMSQADDTSYTITRAYKAGDIDHYSMDLHGSINGFGAATPGGSTEFKLTISMKETTKSVNADGSASLLDEIDSALAKVGDQELDAASFMPAVTSKRDKLGRILETKSEGGGAAAGPLGQASPSQLISGVSAALFPQTPVKVGDTWKVQPPADASKAGLLTGGTGTATFVSTEIVGGVKTARIKVVSDATIKPMAPDGAAVDPAQLPKELTVHIEGTGNIDLATGKLIKMTGAIEFAPKTDSGAAGAKNRIDFTSTLSTGAAAAK